MTASSFRQEKCIVRLYMSSFLGYTNIRQSPHLKGFTWLEPNMTCTSEQEDTM